MGKTDEALSVCLDAKELLYKDDLALMDDLTLSTLQIVLQRLDHLDLATSCYAHACGKYPNNLELMMGLFNCYVREYSFVKQQQTAIKMYKLAGEERFLLWAVCSIQLQVLCDKSGEKLLLLAEGLLKKHIASHSMHEPEGKFTNVFSCTSCGTISDFFPFLLLMTVWCFQLSWCISLCWNNNPNTMML
jgi:N-terminal acetyltransferase B complex non-catalytic subunit